MGLELHKQTCVSEKYWVDVLLLVVQENIDDRPWVKVELTLVHATQHVPKH